MAESIRERERELEIIFESSPVGLLLTEPSPSFAFAKANQSALDLFGYAREEVLGKTGSELGLWRDAADREQMIQQLQQGPLAQREARACARTAAHSCA
jgi:PAS domain S-box-containing protein